MLQKLSIINEIPRWERSNTYFKPHKCHQIFNNGKTNGDQGFDI